MREKPKILLSLEIIINKAKRPSKNDINFQSLYNFFLKLFDLFQPVFLIFENRQSLQLMVELTILMNSKFKKTINFKILKDSVFIYINNFSLTLDRIIYFYLSL